MKAFLNTLKDYIGYFMAIAGATSFVFALGIKSANKDNKSAEIERTVKELKISVDSIDSRQRVFINDLRDYKKEVGSYIDRQDKFLRNYSKFVQDNTTSVKQWMEYMQGLTFEIVKSEEMRFPETKIKIMKVDTLKK